MTSLSSDDTSVRTVSQGFSAGVRHEESHSVSSSKIAHSRRTSVKDSSKRPSSKKSDRISKAESDESKGKRLYSLAFERSDTLGRSKLSGTGSVNMATSPGSGVMATDGRKNGRNDRGEFSLSSDEMRNKLFSSFKSRGILNGIKTQLRADLVSAINNGQNITLPKRSEIISFAARISDCIVAEHLKKSKYEYTLSVFKAESRLSEFNFDPFEVLDIMKLRPDSEVHQRLLLCLSKKDSKSFLWNFISEMLPCKRSANVSVECQTCNFIPTLDQGFTKRMSEIEDEVYQKGQSDLNKSVSLEEQLFEMQKKMEIQKKKELEFEKETLKDGLIRRLRLQEQEKKKVEIDEYKAELDRMYREMTENLRKKEENMDKLINDKKKQLEDEAYEKRQTFLEELTKLKEREAVIIRKNESEEKLAALEESRLRSLAEELRIKEISLKTIEDRYEIKLKEEILKLKEEEQELKESHGEFYKEQESKLREEKLAFEQEKALLMRYRNDFETLKNENMQLQAALNFAKQKMLKSGQKSNELKEKLREFADYSSLREKLLLKENEVDDLRTSLNELKKDKAVAEIQHKNDMKELMNKFMKGTPKTAKLKEQIVSEREEFFEKESELKMKFKEAERRLQTERARNEEIMQMYDECWLQNKALRRATEDLERLKKPPYLCSGFSKVYEGSVERSKVSPSASKFQLNNKIETQRVNDILHIDSPLPIQQYTPTNHDFLPDAIFVPSENETKTMFERLEKEAAALEQKYEYYQSNRTERVKPSKYYETPKPSEFKQLQKYDSTYNQGDMKSNQDVSQEKLPSLLYETNGRRGKSPSRGADDDAISEKNNVVRDCDGGFFKKNRQQSNGKFLTDTWNDGHLTEQLLESAANQHDTVYRLPSSMSDHESKTRTSDRPEMQKFDRNAKPTNDLLKLKKEDFDNKQKQEQLNFVPSLETIQIPKNALSYNTNGLSEESVKKFLKEEELSKREYQASSDENESYLLSQKSSEASLQGHILKSIENEAEMEIEEAFGKKEVFREEPFELPGGKRSDQMSPESVDDGDREKADQNDSEDKTVLSSDSIVSKIKDEEKAKDVGGGRNEEHYDDNDNIDPLMKHYMAMLLKKKGEAELVLNGEDETESVVEQGNSTDVLRIASNFSQFEDSDLVEGEVEKVSGESGDDFDW